MADTQGAQVSQHYVQVVGTPTQDGELRVRRLYAEVLLTDLASILEKSASSALSLTGDVEYTSTAQHVTDTFNLTQDAAITKTQFLSASHTLNMVSLGGRPLPATVTADIGITQAISHFNYVSDKKPAGSALNLVQTVVCLSSLSPKAALALTQTVNIRYPYHASLSHPLGLNDSSSTPHRVFISDSLVLFHRGSVPLPIQYVTDTLNLTYVGTMADIDQELNLSQVAAYGFHYSIKQTLNLTDSQEMQATWIRSATHSNIIGHAMTWFEDTPCGRKQYAPFQGENTISETSTPRNTLQDPQGDTETFSLYQPYLGTPNTQVTLRKPELDNRDRNAYTRVNQETRGGKLIVFTDPDWPKVRTLAVTIVGLTEEKVDELQSFALNTIGEEIGLDDWEGRLWKGFITNPNEVAVQDGRGMWTLSFEFQGEMLEVEQPDVMTLNITQSVGAVIV